MISIYGRQPESKPPLVDRASRDITHWWRGPAEPQDIPARVQRGLARHSVPLLLIARLAVDRAEQGRGLGKALLKDALLRCSNVADIAGVRTVVVPAKSDAARSWYEHFDFGASPTDPYHLFLLMKDLRALLRDV